MERLRVECMKCILDHNIDKYPEDISEHKKIEYIQKLNAIMAGTTMDQGAPVIVRDITELQEEMFGIKNEFGPIKVYFNDVMLAQENKVRETIKNSEDSLKTAIGYALAGNFIDFGAMKEVDEKELKNQLDKAAHFEPDEKEYASFKADLEKGKSLLYITDNCGEVVMDKLLIETIKELYPAIEVKVLVRGGDVLNDATMEDALQVGLDKVAKVIPNGTRIAGTVPEEMTEEARLAYYGADILISKGQGNFESLRKCGNNIYYLFLCKCPMFARIFKVPTFTGMLINDKSLDKYE